MTVKRTKPNRGKRNLAPRVSKRWIKSAADERAIANGCWFDEEAADHFVEFCSAFCCHSKGEWAGKPLELLDWQRDDLFKPLFGWKQPDGTRRFHKLYCELPKKNGKSTMAAAVGLYMLVGDGEPGAEIYSAATDSKQASIVHGEAILMVEASPELSALLDINKTTKNIAFPATNSYYRALSSGTAGARTKEGYNAHCILADELHAWYGRLLYDAIKFAFAARRQGLFFQITTAGDDMLSICREQHDYAVKIEKGQHYDQNFMGYIRAADPDDDLRDPEVQKKANPSWGVTIKPAKFASEIEEALSSPTTVAALKRYRFNIWTTGATAWLKPGLWDSAGESYTLDRLVGQKCGAGLDLAKTSDMTAAVFCFLCDDGIYRLWPLFWMPAARVDDKNETTPFRAWADAGYLRVTPGDVSDYATIEADVAAIAKRTRASVAFDPWNAEQFTQQLEAKHGIERVQFPQTVAHFNEPMKELERLLLAKEMRHPNHPILSWQAGHVSTTSDASENIRPVKPPQGDNRKIDGIVASIMGLSRVMKAKSITPRLINPDDYNLGDEEDPR